MKKVLLSIVYLMIFACHVWAQNQEASFSIKGIVKDKVDGDGLEFSTVMLMSKDSIIKHGINADSAGAFVFHGLANGMYDVTLFYIGFNKKTLTVQVQDADVDLGVITMETEGGKMLKEVEIVDYKKLIEQRPDGLVYNADKDISAKGSTADQLLRKVPMVTVDLEGNVQMRGNGNVKVLIDGKPSTIIAASVKDVLKQIPADNIKSVEVITNPGAKYDAEGAAGVINIITKKSVIKGISGNANSELSYNVPKDFFTGSLGLSLNYRNNKFGLSFNGGFSNWGMRMSSTAIRTDNPNTSIEQTLNQRTQFKGEGNWVWTQLSADYQIDSFQSIQGGMNFNPGNWNQYTQVDNQFDPAIVPGFSRNTDSRSPRQNMGIYAVYTKKFKQNPKRTLDVLAQYAIDKSERNYTLEGYALNNNIVNYKEENTNNRTNNEFTLQTDYVHPLKKYNQKIETGLKFINRAINSDYELRSWSLGQGSDLIIDPKRTNTLQYDQQVAAAYAQFSTSLSTKLSLILGARYEYTHINGHQQEYNSGFKSNFNNLLPNAILSYTLKNFSKFKLAYNQRIERPSIEYINPYVNYSDQYNTSQGNPLLVPENTHNIELGYSTFVKQTSINIATFYRHTGNAIEAVTTVGADQVGRTTFQNVAQNNTLGLDLFASTNLFNRLMMNINGNLYYKMLKSPSLNITNNGWQYSGSLYASYKINERFAVAGFAMYNGNKIQLQGYQTGWYYYYLGLQTTLLKGKGTLTLSGENFLNPEIHMTTHYNYQNAIYDVKSIYTGRGVKLSFSVSFGKMQFFKKKTIRNTDLKSESSSQPGMGG
jgi:ferric enterobactin receptor